MKGITYFKKWGFSINEGEGPINIHCSWHTGSFYFYLFGYWFRLWFSVGEHNTFQVERNVMRGIMHHLASKQKPKLVSGGTVSYEELESFLENLVR